MTRLLTVLPLLLMSQQAFAGLFDVFRLEDGHTNWQYVANTSGTVLILALSYTLVRLFLINREARRYNQQLEEIRSELEERVRERTATLDESNRMLQQSNAGLEGEIAEHQATADRLRQSESYIGSILRSMPLLLVGLDREGVVTQWNHRAEEVSGLSAEDVLGKKLWRVYPSITVSPSQIEEAINSEGPIVLKQSHRGRYHFDVTLYSLKGQAEPGVVVLIDDVTQRVMAENMLIQRDKMSSMGELAGSLAHDISTPVNALLMDIREVQARVSELECPPERDPAPMLDDALLRGEQVFAVMSNLLDLSNAQASDMKRADITEIIDHTVELACTVLSVPSGLQFRDVRIERVYEENLPRIPCRATELQQVFLSLFRHCLDALSEVDREGHEPVITLQANNFYGALWLKVQHNGRGISLQEQQVLFDPFFADSSGAVDGDDAGRRLSYPYFIITEQHHGQLAVTSDIDIGTTFHIQLLLE